MGRRHQPEPRGRGRRGRRGRKKKLDIVELLGFAVGAIGMSVADFCGMTPEEFAHTSQSYREAREADQRDQWERTRLLAAICIQPHVKRKIRPQELVPLPWDNKKHTPQHKAVSREEERQRFERLARREKG